MATAIARPWYRGTRLPVLRDGGTVGPGGYTAGEGAPTLGTAKPRTKTPTAEEFLTQQRTRNADVGQQVTDAYVTGITSFDPDKAYDEYMTGAQARFGDVLDKRIETLTGRAVGAGRLDTGFYDEDVGEVAKLTAGEFANEMSSAALNTNAQRLSQYSQMGQFGTNREETAAEIAAGEADRNLMRENARREEKARKRKGIGGLIGGVLGGVGGFVVGGPGGAMAGANIGSRIGGAI